MKHIILMICALCVPFQVQGMIKSYQSPEEKLMETIKNQNDRIKDFEKWEVLLKDIKYINYKNQCNQTLLDCAMEELYGDLALKLIQRGATVSASNAQRILESPYTFDKILEKYKYKIYFKAYQPLKRFSRTFLMGLLTPVSQYRAVNWLWNFFWGCVVIDNACDKGNDMQLTKGQLTSISLLEGTFFIGGILGRYYVAQKALDKLLIHAPKGLKLDKLASLTKKYQDIYPKPLAFMKYVTLFLLSRVSLVH